MRRAGWELITIAGRILIVAASRRKGYPKRTLSTPRWSLAAHMINNLMDSRMGILYSGPSRVRVAAGKQRICRSSPATHRDQYFPAIRGIGNGMTENLSHPRGWGPRHPETPTDRLYEWWSTEPAQPTCWRSYPIVWWAATHLDRGDQKW